MDRLKKFFSRFEVFSFSTDKVAIKLYCSDTSINCTSQITVPTILLRC